VKEFWYRLLQPVPEAGDLIRRELLVQTCQASLFTNALGLVMVCLVTVTLRSAQIGAGLPVWIGLSLVNAVVFHLGVHWCLDHEPVPVGRVRFQTWIFTGFSVIGGTAWGSVTVLALADGDRLAYQAIPCMAVITAMASNIAFAAATPMPFQAFHLALGLTAIGGLVLHGAFSLAAMMVFCLVGAPLLQRDLYLQISGSKLLAHGNHLLAEELRDERAAVEQTNLRLVEANVELSHRATRDPLTGLANRALFSEHLSSTLARSRQLGRAVSVIYFDLDRFKLINDTLGHAAGDELLRQIGPRITQVLREADVLARLGGDEFIVLTLDGESPAGAETGAETGAEVVAERIRQAFQAPFEVGDRSLRVTPSLGVAHDDGRSTGEQLVANADAALYRAKERGRNRVETFDGTLRASLRNQAQGGHVLRRLLASDSVVRPLFSPVLDLPSGLIVAAQTGIRLATEDGPGIPPEEVRHLAERTGMSPLLDEELLRQSSRFRAGPGSTLGAGFRVLSRVGRADVGFEDLARFLRTDEFGNAPLSGLAIAVGEAQIVSDLRTAGDHVQSIRDLGVRVLLDRFGTGVASLSLLGALPWDGIRLHPSLSELKDGVLERHALLAGVLELARHNELPVTATGVAGRPQIDLLRHVGVDQVQGPAVTAALTAWAY
jgi:diguanylate cyclase (GGDEF)-like protein